MEQFDVLDGLQAAVGAIAGSAKVISESGTDRLLDIKSASSSTTLGQASGGTVTLGVELEFIREARPPALPFNFKNPVSAVPDPASRLLPAS